MPKGRDSVRQGRVRLSVDDAHVDSSLNSDLARPWRYLVTPPRRCGQIVYFGLLTFGLTLSSEPVDLDLWLWQLHHRLDLRSADHQSLVLSVDLSCEADG